MTSQGISLRATLIGVVGIVAVSVMVSYAELVITQIQIAICQFAPAAIGFLMLLTLVHRALRRVFRRWLLTPAEIITIYCMVLIGALITSRGLMEKLIPALVGVNYYAKPENKWAETFYPHIPSWLVPFNPRGKEAQPVARMFYEGLRAGERIPWGAWITPLLCWSVIVVAVFFVFLCLATLWRRQWVDHEKLTFPLAQPPLQLVGEVSDAFFSNRLMWAGFAVPVFIFTLNGLHNLYPSVPMVNLQNNLNQYFVERPWRDITYTTIYCSFAAIGFSYLLPTELLFSLTFFYWLTRVMEVIASWLGQPVEAMPLYPTQQFIGFQMAGAYVVLTAFFIRAGLPHFKQVFRKAFGRAPEVDDSQELMPYRVAVWGLTIALVVSVVWCWLAGMSWWLAVIEMVVYLFVVVPVLGRSVAEAGLMMAETSFRPIDLVRLLTPKHTLGAQNLTILAFMDAVFIRDLRGMLLTPVLDGLKMSSSVRLRPRSLLTAIVVAMVVGIFTSAVVQLWLPHRFGGITMYSYVYRGNNLIGFRDHVAALQQPTGYQAQWLGYFVMGAAVTGFLLFMRTRFVWWTLHPIGYALSASWTMIVFWFPITMAWVIKSVILRYGGVKVYQRWRPFFLGMILGEFTMAVFWATFSSITRKPAPFFPWP